MSSGENEHAHPCVSAFEAGFKRALKSPLCLLPACDHFQLANCQVFRSPFVMYAFDTSAMIGRCIVEGDVSKRLFSPVVRGTAGSATWLHMCTEQTLLWMMLKTLQTLALRGLSLTLCIWPAFGTIFHSVFSLWYGSVGITLQQQQKKGLWQHCSSLKHLHERLLIALTKVTTWVFSNSKKKKEKKGKYILNYFWIILY